MNSKMMESAYLISQQSTCCSVRVGCIIEKNGAIISSGYNGVPQGKKTCCKHAHDENWLLHLPQRGHHIYTLNQEKRPLHSAWSAKNEVHAEINAIMNCAKNGISLLGANMWCTASPCPDCAKAIANSGIKKLYFCEAYDRGDNEWKNVLNGLVEIEQVDKYRLYNVDFNQVKTQFFDFNI